MELLPPKIYAYGAIGRKYDIEQAFAEYGIKNRCDYKFGDPSTIYYINKGGNIAMAKPDSDIYYVLLNSSDWTEIKPKERKRYRTYNVSVKEGSSSCDGCEFHSKCNDELKDKCTFAKLLSKLASGPDLNGKTIEIKEISELV